MLRALDLCCCAGGATKGLQMAGYHVTGVDIRPQPHYCGDAFIQASALDVDVDGYDLIWASPPCQRYQTLNTKHHHQHPNLIGPIRQRLQRQPAPWVMENVEGARTLLRSPVMLCGTMFGLNIWRHRWFELGNCDLFFMLPPCHHAGHPVLISGVTRRKGVPRRENVQSEKMAAIGIDWMITKELDEAIPPAYSKFLAEQIQQAAAEQDVSV